jgi:hypothetical protein
MPFFYKYYKFKSTLNDRYCKKNEGNTRKINSFYRAFEYSLIISHRNIFPAFTMEEIFNVHIVAVKLKPWAFYDQESESIGISSMIVGCWLTIGEAGQACIVVHMSFVFRNFSALIRIKGPYSKTIFLHCK